LCAYELMLLYIYSSAFQPSKQIYVVWVRNISYINLNTFIL